tara:strand:- start:8196 stop:9017 length:822 start_codon:yes stop_codon:yes gene_type:complete
MAEANVVEPVKVAGFIKRNKQDVKVEEVEKELEELKQATSEEDTLPPEEKTFKKRYGDLRRHQQKTEADLKKEIESLKVQLEGAAKKEIALPTSEDELNAWMTKYPDVARIVETIAIKKAQEQSSDYETKFKEIDEMRLDAAREKAEAELMQAHPDFEEIRDSEDFHEWVEDQPKLIQDALYENDEDARAASRAIDLYKSDRGIGKSKRKNTNKSAARSVNTKSRTAIETKPGVLKESTVEKMSMKEYEARSEEIAEAMRTGRFEYDLSGSAR